MKIAISQPTYLPWMGYFDLIDQVDTFVFLDDVQFEKQSWQQRNRIKTPTGLQWLTVPVVFRGRLNQLIKDVEIRVPDFWRDHLRAIELNYRRARYFDDYFPKISELLTNCGPSLAQLNISLIGFFCSTLNIKTPVVASSALNLTGKRTALLASICESLTAGEYLSPRSAAEYLLPERSELEQRGIQVNFHNYTHPEYQQQFPPFAAYASVLDLLFNEGPTSLDVIRSGRGNSLSPDQIAAEEDQKTTT